MKTRVVTVNYHNRLATAVIALPFVVGALFVLSALFHIYVRFGLPRFLFAVGITIAAAIYSAALYWAVGVKGREAARRGE